MSEQNWAADCDYGIQQAVWCCSKDGF